MPYQPELHGPRRVVGPGFHERVYELVRRVPAGRVTTYGDLARALGTLAAARHVGYALAALPEGRRDVPWHRVVNARGTVSARGDAAVREQVRRLRREAVAVDATGRVARFAELRWGAAGAEPEGGEAKRRMSRVERALRWSAPGSSGAIP